MSVVTAAEVDGYALKYDPADVETISTPREVNADGTLGKKSIVITFREGASFSGWSA